MFSNRYKLIVSISIIILLLFANVYAVSYIKLVINGQQVYTSVPPQIVNGTTLVPIFVFEYSVAKHLGVNQDLLNWIKQQITTRID